MKPKFKPTWKRKNPKMYVDIRVDSDDFFFEEPDRYYITIWANQYKKEFCDKIDFTVKPSPNEEKILLLIGNNLMTAKQLEEKSYKPVTQAKTTCDF